MWLKHPAISCYWFSYISAHSQCARCRQRSNEPLHQTQHTLQRSHAPPPHTHAHTHQEHSKHIYAVIPWSSSRPCTSPSNWPHNYCPLHQEPVSMTSITWTSTGTTPQRLCGGTRSLAQTISTRLTWRRTEHWRQARRQNELVPFGYSWEKYLSCSNPNLLTLMYLLYSYIAVRPWLCALLLLLLWYKAV